MEAVTIGDHADGATARLALAGKEAAEVLALRVNKRLLADDR